jgi:molybdate transport system ATP-binding protein
VPGLGVALSHCTVRLGRKVVLDEVSLALRPGEKWLLVGPNGAGKTQLIKLLAGLRWPTPTGRERRTYADHRGRVVELVDARERVAYVGAESQDKYARYGWNHTLEQVVATGLFGTDIPLDEPDLVQRRQVRTLLERFALTEVRGRRMLEASYGQRRLALVARALAARPGLLLLDEVYNGLDDGHRRRLTRALAGLSRTRVTVLASAHRPEDVPPGVERAAVVEQGRVRVLPWRTALRRLRRAAAPASAVPDRQAACRRRRGVQPFLELRDVWVYREETPALRGLDWVLEDGEHWAITGRNGSGKSTLLGLLYGSWPPALGSRVFRRGHPPGTSLEEIRAGIGIVSPELQAAYEAGATLEEIVVSGLRDSVGLDSPPTRRERRLAAEALALVDLGPLADRRPREVSYGELRLALLARAFVKKPELLLLDEPFTGLDPGRRRRLRAALSRLAKAGTRLVIAVHHRGDLPHEVNRRLHLRRGRAGRLPV